MPRHRSFPAYTLHKPSGQARVRINGQDVYLGQFDSPGSREKYALLIVDLARQQQSPITPVGNWTQNPLLTVKEMVLRYMLHARDYYSATSKEYRSMRDALQPVLTHFGSSPAKDFGPKVLKCVRQWMIDHDLCRTEINRRISRIRRAFRWATSEELIPPSVIHGLSSIQGLARGRSGARESAPVKPVSADVVTRTLPHCSPQVRTMIELQWLTGMRPAEVTIMRPMDLDQSGEIWVYRPSSHKTAYLGVEKEVFLGPRASNLLQPFLNRPAESYLFSPVEAEQWRNDQRALLRNPERKTKIFPCELRARARRKELARRRTLKKRQKRDHFDTDSYRRAITHAIAKAGRNGVQLPHWHPHQLRHLRATEVRKDFGLEAAQVTLGHSRADVTQVYAERNSQLAMRVAREIG